MTVRGVVGNKDIARSNRSNQLFFVNNRYVKDKNLSVAVDQAYKEILPSGKYGFAILNLDMDSSKVDVNVHPAKLEVRFEEENKVFKAVYHGVKSVLESGSFNTLNKPQNIEKALEEENKQEEKEEEKKQEFKPNKESFSGFFKKFIKNHDEEKEENNGIEEIFESRKNAKERLYQDFNRLKNEEVVKKVEAIENKEPEKESDVVSLDFENSNYDTSFASSINSNELKNNFNEMKNDFSVATNAFNDAPISIPSYVETKGKSLAYNTSYETNNFNEPKTDEINSAEDFSYMPISTNFANETTENSNEINFNSSVKFEPEVPSNEPILEETEKTLNNNEIKNEEFNTKELESNNSNIENNENDSKTQEVKLGDTIISSNTKELDINVNDALKEETVKLETTKFIETEENSKTEVIDSLKKMVEEDESKTIVIDNEKINDELKTSKESEENSTNNNVSELEKKSIPTLESVESVTEKLLTMKISADIDDTQMIDTGEIREALSNLKEDEPVTPEFANMYKKVFGTEVAEVRKNKEEENAKLDAGNALKPVGMEANISVFENEAEKIPEVKYRYIGIVFDTYILIEIEDEMYMIDKTAANARIVYDNIRAKYYDDMAKDAQMLLLADIITVSNKEMSIARQDKELFNKAGFDYDEFGDNTIKLTTVPSMCEEMNTKKLFLDILDEMDTVAITEEREREEKFVATVAYKVADNRNMNLTEEEIQELLKILLSIPNPFICPYGKQVAIKLTKGDLEKKFSRR